jgi:hypothetical protein
MTNPLPDPLEALRDRFAFEGILGQGGMSVVYRARPAAGGAPVALKLLRPELAAVLGRDRFTREIGLAAGLSHPNILPVLESGETAGGLLWFTMPLVAGGSLRERLLREPQLPVLEAIRIGAALASALDCAHRQDVIHRDLKPENVLLGAGGAVLLADFGVARKVDATTLTEPGMAVGTVTYMSPEQASATRDLDSRSDQYSLACLVYEMFAGAPPFSGPTAQAILARHAVDPPPPLRTVRPTVPAHVEAALARALAKVPADRFETVAEFGRALTDPSIAPEPAVTGRVSPGVRWRWVVAVTAVVAAAILVSRFIGGRGPRPDPHRVVILPFRVTAADTSLAPLGEGLAELLAVKLNGDAGPRAVDPGAVHRRLERAGFDDASVLSEADASAIARQLGAGLLVRGSVVQTGPTLIVNAELRGGPAPVQAAAQGPVDSLPAMVDHLTSQLLARTAGEQETRLEDLTTRSLPSLRSYLAGLAAFRRGRYADAVYALQGAVAADSTFALASLALASASWFKTRAADGGEKFLALAWPYRDRLGSRDRALLSARLGPRYPAPSPVSEQFAAWEQLARSAGDWSEAWYWLGEFYWHSGAAAGLAAPLDRAAEAFRRSAALDSSVTAPLDHLIEKAGIDGDTGLIRRLGAHYLTVDSTASHAGFIRWRVAQALGDSALLDSLRSGFREMSRESLRRIIIVAQRDQVGLPDADLASQALLAGVATADEPGEDLTQGAFLAMNRGRPTQVAEIIRAFQAIHPDGSGSSDELIFNLFWSGDSVRAATAAALLHPDVQTLLTGRKPAVKEWRKVCASGLWRASQGRADALRASGWLARPQPAMTPGDDIRATRCAAMIEVMAAAGPTALHSATARLDSVLEAQPRTELDFTTRLVLARARERLGDPGAALATLRRQPGGDGQYLASYLYEIGRLADLTGDREAAIAAYQHYLALRAQPEASLAPKVAGVRSELERLLREPR